jgi:hypothetical protein
MADFEKSTNELKIHALRYCLHLLFKDIDAHLEKMQEGLICANENFRRDITELRLEYLYGVHIMNTIISLYEEAKND